MAGVAGDVFAVFVQMIVQQAVPVMGFFGMTVFTGDRPFHNRCGGAPAGDFVVPGLMTIHAPEIVSSHVNIAAA